MSVHVEDVSVRVVKVEDPEGASSLSELFENFGIDFDDRRDVAIDFHGGEIEDPDNHQPEADDIYLIAPHVELVG